ncbi:hypothetical protein DLAC_03740 [Tieghemostelium lacteum]|uniref:Homologous recombination OB-fold protein OB-fold domain-containing protein n=1 Tax=Tieghemostelium lacteum TaxID=361077 RepID=A0A152A139_TIELA|nr:hypothetical protein DLAC_03740 [Tieghemostelium lacteum]|eukprot:KYQ99794.1 hypothetical protein DLAC_03740 [Tieghemostelium lacteum]
MDEDDLDFDDIPIKKPTLKKHNTSIASTQYKSDTISNFNTQEVITKQHQEQIPKNRTNEEEHDLKSKRLKTTLNDVSAGANISHQKHQSPPPHQQPQQQPQQQQQVRRLPGPAGSLPPLEKGKISQIASQISKMTDDNTKRILIKDFRNSSLFDNVAFEVDFTKGPWLQMLKDRRLPPFKRDELSTLLKYNVDYVLREGFIKKINQIVVVVKSLVGTDSHYQGIVCDPSGEMGAWFQKKIIQDIYPDLAVGWVLVLKKISTFSPNRDTHYLNIVLSNIEYVYRTDSEQIPQLEEEFNQLISDQSVGTYEPSLIYQDIPKKSEDELSRELLDKKLTKASNVNLAQPPPPVPQSKKIAPLKPKAKAKPKPMNSKTTTTTTSTTTPKTPTTTPSKSTSTPVQNENLAPTTPSKPTPTPSPSPVNNNKLTIKPLKSLSQSSQLSNLDKQTIQEINQKLNQDDGSTNYYKLQQQQQQEQKPQNVQTESTESKSQTVKPALKLKLSSFKPSQSSPSQSVQNSNVRQQQSPKSSSIDKPISSTQELEASLFGDLSEEPSQEVNMTDGDNFDILDDLVFDNDPNIKKMVQPVKLNNNINNNIDFDNVEFSFEDDSLKNPPIPSFNAKSKNEGNRRVLK